MAKYLHLKRKQYPFFTFFIQYFCSLSTLFYEKWMSKNLLCQICWKYTYFWIYQYPNYKNEIFSQKLWRFLKHLFSYIHRWQIEKKLSQFADILKKKFDKVFSNDQNKSFFRPSEYIPHCYSNKKITIIQKNRRKKFSIYSF